MPLQFGAYLFCHIPTAQANAFEQGLPGLRRRSPAYAPLVVAKAQRGFTEGTVYGLRCTDELFGDLVDLADRHGTTTREMVSEASPVVWGRHPLDALKNGIRNLWADLRRHRVESARKYFPATVIPTRYTLHVEH